MTQVAAVEPLVEADPARLARPAARHGDDRDADAPRCQSAENRGFITVAEQHIAGESAKQGYGFRNRGSNAGKIGPRPIGIEAARANRLEKGSGSTLFGEADEYSFEVLGHRLGETEHLPLRAAEECARCEVDQSHE